MASSINASTSGAGGVITTADNTGILNIQTASTTAVTVDASQNVGINTTAPAGKLEVNATSGAQLVLNDSASTGNGNKTVTLAAFKNGVGYHNLLINGFDLRFAIGGGATEAMRIDSSGTLLFNSGYGSVATAYGCRAWVNFNGQGTVAIRASGNVSSITDNGVGNYTINFTTAFPNTNYTGVTGIQRVGASEFVNLGFNRSTSSDQVETFSGGTQADSAAVQLAYFR